MKQKNTLKTAIGEYFVHGIFIVAFYFIWTNFPYYKILLNKTAQTILWDLTLGYLILGLPYFFVRKYIWPKHYENYEQSKPQLVLDVLFGLPKKIIKLLKTSPKNREFLKPNVDEKTRVALTATALKFFYIPLMLAFFLDHYFGLVRAFSTVPANIFTLASFNKWGYSFILDILFATDTIIFLFGYIFEAKFLKNIIKSVDPFFSGWFFALVCYPPFNSISGSIFKGGGFGTNTFFLIPQVAIILKIVIILLYLVYVWATIALWTKSSNLTNRGIVSDGPYKYIRHPAYIAKNIAWWLEQAANMTSPVKILALLVWNVIYFMRALTEERHLLKDPDYQKYVRRVKYRFIPGVV